MMSNTHNKRATPAPDTLADDAGVSPSDCRAAARALRAMASKLELARSMEPWWRFFVRIFKDYPTDDMHRLAGCFDVEADSLEKRRTSDAVVDPQPTCVRTGKAGPGDALVLRPTFAPMKFADTVRCYHDGIGERFDFTDRTGHVHGEYRKGCAISRAPDNAIGAVKIGEAWHWVLASQTAEVGPTKIAPVKNRTYLVSLLSEWERIAFDHEPGFLERFCGNAWQLAKVSWTGEAMHVVYIVDSGMHVTNSFPITEWLEFFKANISPAQPHLLRGDSRRLRSASA